MIGGCEKASSSESRRDGVEAMRCEMECMCATRFGHYALWDEKGHRFGKRMGDGDQQVGLESFGSPHEDHANHMLASSLGDAWPR